MLVGIIGIEPTRTEITEVSAATEANPRVLVSQRRRNQRCVTYMWLQPEVFEANNPHDGQGVVCLLRNSCDASSSFLRSFTTLFVHVEYCPCQL